jgi:hypothetical protein
MKVNWNGQTADINPSHRKENKFQQSLIAVNLRGERMAEARFYFSGQTWYCCFWGHIYGWTAGSAKAGGYGYCKQSAAFAYAAEAAGIKFSEPIASRGLEVCKQAMQAIADLAGGFVVHAHG